MANCRLSTSNSSLVRYFYSYYHLHVGLVGGGLVVKAKVECKAVILSKDCRLLLPYTVNSTNEFPQLRVSW